MWRESRIVVIKLEEKMENRKWSIDKKFIAICASMCIPDTDDSGSVNVIRKSTLVCLFTSILNLLCWWGIIADNFQVMPISGFLISKLLNLPSHYAAGLILVACCPGGMTFNFGVLVSSRAWPDLCSPYLVAGTASNIVTYLARYITVISIDTFY